MVVKLWRAQASSCGPVSNFTRIYLQERVIVLPPGTSWTSRSAPYLVEMDLCLHPVTLLSMFWLKPGLEWIHNCLYKCGAEVPVQPPPLVWGAGHSRFRVCAAPVTASQGQGTACPERSLYRQKSQRSGSIGFSPSRTLLHEAAMVSEKGRLERSCFAAEHLGGCNLEHSTDAKAWPDTGGVSVSSNRSRPESADYLRMVMLPRARSTAE